MNYKILGSVPCLRHEQNKPFRIFLLRAPHLDHLLRYAVKMDHVGPYHGDQEYAVAMQRKHDMDRAVPATEQITKWEWVDGVTAIADIVFGTVPIA